MSNPVFLTTLGDAGAGASTRPPAQSDGERYLLAVLDSQRGINIALDALNARTAFADAQETRFIEVQKGLLMADKAKLDAMLNSYLSAGQVMQPVSAAQLTAMRAAIDKLAELKASKDRAAAIMEAVANVLGQWS